VLINAIFKQRCTNDYTSQYSGKQAKEKQ